MDFHIAGSASDLTTDTLTALMRQEYPDVTVTGFNLVEVKAYGGGEVSAAGRIIADLQYDAGAPADLPSRVVIKVPVEGAPYADVIYPLYQTEVSFYQKLRREITIETPRFFGGFCNRTAKSFGLILEDLTLRNVQFPNVLTPVSLDSVRSVLDNLAKLHAQFWDSPRFTTDLAWMETHVQGDMQHYYNAPDMMPAHTQNEIDTEQFKREMVQRLRTTGAKLLVATQKIQLRQSTLPQTVLHGDSHIGNTYLLPDGSGGLLDWQMTVRGYCMHDITYFIVTSLSVADRREHEATLIKFYRECLLRHGLKNPPSFDTLWLEYRLATVWGVYVGWLTTPVSNYGWEICVINHLRLMTAYEDHDNAAMVAKYG